MPKFKKGDRVRVARQYAKVTGKVGTVVKAWDEPDRDCSWARVMFGCTKDGSALRQTIPENCLEYREVTVASFEQVKKIASSRQYRAFTWPGDGPDDEPVVVDVTTARMLCVVRRGMTEDGKERFSNLIKRDREAFSRLVEASWDCVG